MELDQIKQIMYNDIEPLSPEYTDDFENPLINRRITRYYENENSARAYCLVPYQIGYMILYMKKGDHGYFTSVLKEDDGFWHLWEDSYSLPNCVKNQFITIMSEALSIFNTNYNQK